MKPLSPETDRIRESAIKEKLAKENAEMLVQLEADKEKKDAKLKADWDALSKPTNPSVKQLQARVEILEGLHGMKA